MQIAINISEDDYRKVQDGRASVAMMRNAIRNGTPLPKEEESKVMLSNLDRSMGYVLESDHRSFSNRETENGWLFDHIIEWRKMIKPYIKEE